MATKKKTTKKAPKKATVAKKPAAKKKTAAKKPAAKQKAAAKKPAAKKTAAKKKPAKKTAAKKTSAKKPAARKTAAKKPAARKPAAKKTAAKKKPAVKRATKKPAARRTAAKKPAVKKAVVKKPVEKKVEGPTPPAKPVLAVPKNKSTKQYTQTEFFDSVMGSCGFVNRKQAKEFYENFSGMLQSALKSGYRVPLPGLGKIQVKKTPARTYRNPQTQEPIRKPAGKKVAFTANKALKEAVL